MILFIDGNIEKLVLWGKSEMLVGFQLYCEWTLMQIIRIYDEDMLIRGSEINFIVYGAAKMSWTIYDCYFDSH